MFLKLLTSLCLSAALLNGCTGLPSDAANDEYTTEVVGADLTSGFNYPYILRQPTTPIAENHRSIIVEFNNTAPYDDYQNQIEQALKPASGFGLGANLATKLNTP